MKKIVFLILIGIYICLLHQIAWSGQIVYASFDDVPLYVNVGDHYPGAFIYGAASPWSWAHSAPNALYNDLKWDPIHFPQGATWVSLYTHGVAGVGAVAADGTSLGWIPISGYSWSFIELRYDRPISYITVGREGTMAYYIDDLTYELVPESASLASLLGMIGLFGVGYRRRRTV